ncbi:RagB/SusD family nutrient uptake outer membrane protein [Flavobacteriaceae bacterium F08102]|nr:RagB/SusD family nutrient uptake outer membrane protein [Flavobacteriaceae bacterium F08102]
MTGFISCDSFLDERPSKSTSIVPETLEHLEALLNRYSTFASEPSNELIFSTDDYGFNTDLYDASSSTYGTTELTYGTWDVDIAQTVTGRIFWPTEWRKIFTANLVLENLGKVSGDPAKKEQIKAECHFIRAYSYFEMAMVYCLPYTEANKGELGLPLKQATSFEENIARATLEETYAFIEADLQEAFKLTASFDQVNNLNHSWRASTAAVNSFAARYYLSLNDYEKAQTYAQKALDEYDGLRNYNTDMRYSDLPSDVTIFNPDQTQFTILYPYTHDLRTFEDRFEFGETYYYRELSNAGWKYWPSEELLNLYDKTNDLRYKYHIVEGYSYDRGAKNPAFDYPGYIYHFKSEIPMGPSVPEMILTKAEAQIRQGAWQDGIQTVNQLRVARMDMNAAPSDIYLSAVSQADALTKVLNERRRELPIARRWFDLRRYNNNEDPSDDVVVTRTFYPFNANTILGQEAPITYTLEKNSRRYAFPIPNTDIIASGGVLQQNTY